MEIYNHRDYKQFLRQRIESLPKAGRGESLKLARFLRVHPTMISQVLGGEKHFSPEHALKVGEYFGFDERETQYFLTMVLKDRAGSVDLEAVFDRQLNELREKSLKSVHQIKKHKKLQDREASRFYSSWKYSAVRLMTSVPQTNTAQEMADHLALNPIEVAQILRFLVDAGLVVATSGEGYEMTEKTTFLSAESPLYSNHHSNWRLRAMDACSEKRKGDFTFTAPMTLSEEDFARIRQSLLQQIKELSATVTESEPEVLACLNIDFFKLGR